MHIINLIFLVFSFVMFVMAGMLLPSPPNWPHRLIAWGLALFILTLIFSGIGTATIVK